MNRFARSLGTCDAGKGASSRREQGEGQKKLHVMATGTVGIRTESSSRVLLEYFFEAAASEYPERLDRFVPGSGIVSAADAVKQPRP